MHKKKPVTLRPDQPFYGLMDLVKTPFFKNKSAAHLAVASKELKSYPVNKKGIVVTREDLINYLREYRDIDVETNDFTLNLRLGPVFYMIVKDMIEKMSRLNFNYDVETMVKMAVHSFYSTVQTLTKDSHDRNLPSITKE